MHVYSITGNSVVFLLLFVLLLSSSIQDISLLTIHLLRHLALFLFEFADFRCSMEARSEQSPKEGESAEKNENDNCTHIHIICCAQKSVLLYKLYRYLKSFSFFQFFTYFFFALRARNIIIVKLAIKTGFFGFCEQGECSQRNRCHQSRFVNHIS